MPTVDNETADLGLLPKREMLLTRTAAAARLTRSPPTRSRTRSATLCTAASSPIGSHEANIPQLVKLRADEDAFPSVIDSLEKCLPTAEKCGVVLGQENHWGLGRTPEGVLRIVVAMNSPWLRVTPDTGNFLNDPYDRLAMLSPKAAFVQAKTFHGMSSSMTW